MFWGTPPSSTDHPAHPPPPGWGRRDGGPPLCSHRRTPVRVCEVWGCEGVWIVWGCVLYGAVWSVRGVSILWTCSKQPPSDCSNYTTPVWYSRCIRKKLTFPLWSTHHTCTCTYYFLGCIRTIHINEHDCKAVSCRVPWFPWLTRVHQPPPVSWERGGPGDWRNLHSRSQVKRNTLLWECVEAGCFKQVIIIHMCVKNTDTVCACVWCVGVCVGVCALCYKLTHEIRAVFRRL